MNHTLTINPILPVPQVMLILVVCVAIGVWTYRKTSQNTARNIKLLTTLRVIAIVAISLLLLNPVFTIAARDLEHPPLLVLMDTSHSMSIADVNGKRRFDVAMDDIIKNSDIISALQKRFTVHLFTFNENATRSSFGAFTKTVKPDGQATQIGESLTTAVESEPQGSSGGVLVVSDGRNNGNFSPVEAARESRERGFPVFTLCLGSNAHGQNASIANHRPQIYAAPGQTVTLASDLSSVGLDGQTAHVDLIGGNGALVATKDYTLDDNRIVPVTFDVTQSALGNYQYTISVRPLPGEVTTADNKTTLFLQVIKNRARVLVLEARPSWDAKFLIQALRTDPTISVDAIFKLTDDKFFALKDPTRTGDSSGTSEPTEGDDTSIKLPTTAADFAHYDVIIIGKGYSDLFGPTGVAALEDYIANHAGNVVFLRGKAESGNTDTLHQLEPMQWTTDQITNLQLEVTQEGKSNPAFDFSDHPDPQLAVQKLPSLLSATKVQGEKALSVVLARSSSTSEGDNPQQMALLAYQNYGQGKVVALAGEGLWQWALLPPELNGYADCFNEFWTQMVRWLVNQSDFLPGQDVTLKTERSSYIPGDTVNFLAFTRGSVKNSLPPVEITDPDGKNTELTLSKGPIGQADFVGSYRAAKPGEYVASLVHQGGGIVRTPFSVYPSTLEDLVTASDPSEMKSIAEAGGGDVVTTDTISTLPTKFKTAQQSLAICAEPVTAWDQWWVLALILAVLSTEWFLRRKNGLV